MQGVKVMPLDRLLRPLHRWVWNEPSRRARKLLSFALTEEDGGRDLSRAAELTSDPVLRRCYLQHAADEQRHARLFRERGLSLLRDLPSGTRRFEAAWLAPGERGLDDLRVDEEQDGALLAFLHLSERAAAARFQLYSEVLQDAQTRQVFAEVLRDEVFHVRYSFDQLSRVAPRRTGRALWRARGKRVWKAYLRFATALAGLLGGVMLTAQYFLIIPVFAWFARRSARHEPRGWHPARPVPDSSNAHSPY
jgi:rubrerythrin